MRWRRALSRGLLLLLLFLQPLVAPAAAAASVASVGEGTALQPLPMSSQALAQRSPWSRPESYPLERTPRADLYRPSAEWIGRLILPDAQERSENGPADDDWVWMEVEQAPAGRRSLIGRRLRLRWQPQPELQRLIHLVTTDIRFGESARRAAAEFNVVPERLNGRTRVGPLQSLAGARPTDDVTVLLEGVREEADALRIARPPVQISGRWQALVRIEEPAPGIGDGDDLTTVRHFNGASGRFDGVEETIRIPRLPPDRFGRRLLDPTGLAHSALNPNGWLIQGAPASDGVFTVQAIEPYALLEVEPQRRVGGTDRALAWLHREPWSQASLRRGSLESATLVPDGVAAPAWRTGERALLMHLFGGIGGKNGEPVAGGTVTGHFAFGEAQVVRDAFTDRPRWAIRYHQIYANNPNGIVAGSQDWSAYAGNLQRGWLGTRPFFDGLVPLEAEVLDAIALQTEILAARYRSGDGGGVALVTAATSCVQDSGQALWIAIQQLRRQREASPTSEAGREQLKRLGTALDQLLTPFGRVRGDWKRNASLALAAGTGRFRANQGLGNWLLSWRSLLPRGAHDAFAAEFLWAGLPLQVLRTNQIPGADPWLAPVAPTTVLGAIPVVGTLLNRLGNSLFPPLHPTGQLAALAILGVYVPVALTLGRRSGLLPPRWRRPAPRPLLAGAAVSLLLAALPEELLFRGLLLPSALEGVSPPEMVPWIALSIGLFVAWHRLKTRLRRRAVRERGRDPRHLTQVTLLGLACSLAYAIGGSLWQPVLIHTLALVGGRLPGDTDREDPGA
jgi:predicted Abi (CAAX) family protease